MVGHVTFALLQIVCRVWQWKNFENQSIIGKDMDKSKAAHFLLAHGVCMLCGGSIPQHLGRHGPMESAVAWAYNRVWRQSPQQGPGAEPLVRESGGKATWSWSTFVFWTFNGSCKFAYIFKILKCKEIWYMCYLCKKSWMAMKLGACASPTRA